MTKTYLKFLAVLAVVSVGTTAAALRTTAPTIASDHRGESVLPAVLTKANDVTSVSVREGTDPVLTIERRGNDYVVADSGYPVKSDAVRDLIVSSGQLTFAEARTSDASRYGDLGLADPGTPNTPGKDNGAGKEIAFRASGGQLADFIVGNRDTTAGGPAGGVFVRLNGAPQTFLANGSVKLPATRTDWFVPVDFDVKRSEIKKIELSGGGRDPVTATAEKPGELIPANVPEKRVADSFKVSRLVTPVESFAFQDVRKRTKPAEDARHMVVDAEDGLRLTITSVGDIREGWVQISAEATNDAKQDKAKGITAKVAAYDFRLPSNLSEPLGWTITDVTNEEQAAPPPGPQGGPPGGLPPGFPPGGLPPGIRPGSLPPGLIPDDPN